MVYARRGPDLADFTGIARTKVPEAIAAQIQSLIAAKKLQPGDRLPSERELARALGASRNSLREALRSLATLGFLEIRHGEGAFLRQPNLEPLVTPLTHLMGSERAMLREVVESRRMVELEVVGLAAERVTPEELSNLEVTLKEASSPEGMARKSRRLDLEFEQALGGLARNRVIAMVQKLIHEVYAEAWIRLGKMPLPVEQRNQEHWEIFRAVAARDPGRARAAMARHLAVLDRIIGSHLESPEA